MLKNFFKTAWRNILKSKGYSALNIIGLAAGMAVALLIGLWAYNEYSYDKFLPDGDRLYQVRRNFNSNGEVLNFTSTSLKLADALRRNIPEIEYVAETDYIKNHGLMVGDKKFYLPGAQVGSDFLKMFQFSLLQGNASKVLSSPYSIVLTEATAKSLFGGENAMGKLVRIDNRNNLTVTGILKNLPSNSSFQFNYIIPFSYLEQTSEGARADRAGGFSDNGYQIYAKLKPGISYGQVAPKIKDIEKTETGSINAMLSDVVMQPLNRWHLYSEYINGKDSGGFIEYVRMFSIIGILVLLIACINFINLTTARSQQRAREVGVRKALGSQRKELIVQFLAESFLITLIAFLFSIIFVQLALPSFNLLTGKLISIPFSNSLFWIISLSCVVLTALIAGSRPAFYLSSFNPVSVLKGTLQVGKGKTLPRKILVVVQFSCSIALTISTIVIYQQVQYAKKRPTGYDVSRLMVTQTNDDLNKNFTALKNELLEKGIVTSVTTATSPATNIYWHTNIDWPGKNPGETIEMGAIGVSSGYFKTLGMSMREGRDYGANVDTVNVIFNEEAIRRMRLKNPINQTIVWNMHPLRIIGVTKDALMVSPFSPADPTMFMFGAEQFDNIIYRLSPNLKTEDAVKQLTSIFNKYSPSYPYVYQFADENYASKFNLELLIGKLAGVFATLAIFISCLGLFGLAAFVAEQRTKEIGIRKVLGASVAQLWLLLSKDFIVLVSISCVLASSIAFYFLQNWLQKYVYRINLGVSVFLMAAALAIVITMITISFQAIKAAVVNPVKSLKAE